MNLFATIQSLYPTFTKSEKKISDYLLSSDRKEFTFMHLTLEDFATEVGVGQATVIRYIRKCGYNTYRQFFLDFYEASRELRVSSRLSQKQSGNTLLSDIIVQLNACQAAIREETLSDIFEHIKESALIVCTGLGSSSHAAALTAARLRAENILAVSAPYREIGFHGRIMHDNPNTILMAFSISGETPELIDEIKKYKELDAYIIAFTGHTQSTLAKLSDAVLYTASQLIPGTYPRDLHSVISQLYVAETIVDEYISRITPTE
jgi:DNA-binding MurR/RpiR family transcriptional regulator